MPVAAGARRLPVRFDERVWQEALRGFSGRALEVAVSTRTRLGLEGLALTDALACAAQGADAWVTKYGHGTVSEIQIPAPHSGFP